MPPQNNKQGFPGLDRIQDTSLQLALRALWDTVSHLKGRGGATISLEGPLNVGGNRVTNVADPTADTDVVTKGYADTHYGSSTSVAFQTSGSGTAIIPTVPTTSTPQVLYDTHANRIGLADHHPTRQPDGALFYETDRKVIYQVQLVAGVPTWVYIAGTMSGTIDTATADQKPTDLNTNDTGFLFSSTDFDRIFKWSGSAWADAPGQPLRFMVSFFTSDTIVIPGWALCDGSSVTRSTGVGGVAAYTVPDLITDGRFIRSTNAGATGTTGGAATVNPPATTSGGPNNTTTVQSGAGVDVASDDHTHDTDLAALSILPPYIEMRPYIRL